MMYQTYKVLVVEEVVGKGLVVYGLTHVPCLLISYFEGGKVGLKE